VKECIFTGSDIRKLLCDATFESTMNATEKAAWQAFRDVTKFHGKKKDPNYTSIVNNMLDAFKDLCCNMSLELHFLKSHLDYFPENLGSLSEEQGGERFHQNVKEIKKQYQGRWNINMLAGYC
jgi:YesN/AraC family two-component response regulator